MHETLRSQPIRGTEPRRGDVRDTWACRVCMSYRIHRSRFTCSECGAPRRPSR